tara:strand:+ start:1874 stop:2206 length:333 start_codon:yes stop_codon:yes gene_type:complete
MDYNELMYKRVNEINKNKISSLKRSELKKYIKKLEKALHEVNEDSFIIPKESGNGQMDLLSENFVNLIENGVVESFEFEQYPDKNFNCREGSLHSIGELTVKFLMPNSKG